MGTEIWLSLQGFILVLSVKIIEYLKIKVMVRV